MNVLAFILSIGSSAAGSRGGLSYTISGAAVQAPQFVPGVTVVPAVACGGMGAVVVPDEGKDDARRRWALGVQGCTNGVSRYSELYAGLGGQWGGRHGYLTASILPGLNHYEQYYAGRMYEAIGLTTRLRGALGLMVGGLSVEVGPSLSVSALH